MPVLSPAFTGALACWWQLLQFAAKLSHTGHPVVREMHALHQNVQAYMAATRGGGSADGLGSTAERPSGQSVPAHIRKMGPSAG